MIILNYIVCNIKAIKFKIVITYVNELERISSIPCKWDSSKLDNFDSNFFSLKPNKTEQN